MGLHGGQPDDFTGGAQGVSSITGPRGARLDEAWLQHNFLGNRLSLLGGRYDLNGEFYRLHSARCSSTVSFGMGPEFSAERPRGAVRFSEHCARRARPITKRRPTWCSGPRC